MNPKQPLTNEQKVEKAKREKEERERRQECAIAEWLSLTDKGRANELAKFRSCPIPKWHTAEQIRDWYYIDDIPSLGKVVKVNLKNMPRVEVKGPAVFE